MPKNITKTKVNRLFDKREQYIPELLDAVLYYDKKHDNDYANHIVWRLLEIDTNILIDGMIRDLVQRNYRVEENLFYNSIWYTLSNSDVVKVMLFEHIFNSTEKEKIISYLARLIEDKSNLGQINMSLLVERLTK